MANHVGLLFGFIVILIGLAFFAYSSVYDNPAPRQVISLLPIILGIFLIIKSFGNKKKSGTIANEYDRLTSKSKIPKVPVDFIPIVSSENQIIVNYPTQANYTIYSKEAWNQNIIKPHKFKVDVLENHRNIKAGNKDLWVIPLEKLMQLNFMIKIIHYIFQSLLYITNIGSLILILMCVKFHILMFQW